MNLETVNLSLDDAVATVAINRPDKLNALNGQVFADLNHALDSALLHKARCIVLTGAGRAFCSGADLASGASFPDDLGAIIERDYNPFVRRVAGLDVPVITAINGPAVGAGAGLAMLGDITVMARTAYLQLGFVSIGLVPDAGTSWLIGKSAGRAKVLEMALLGEKMDAHTAQDCGLITRVVDDHDCLHHAQTLAKKLAAGATLAMGLIRKQVPAELAMTLDQALDLERDNQRKAGKSEDFKEGVTAFLQKRAPRFKGH